MPLYGLSFTIYVSLPARLLRLYSAKKQILKIFLKHQSPIAMQQVFAQPELLYSGHSYGDCQVAGLLSTRLYGHVFQIDVR